MVSATANSARTLRGRPAALTVRPILLMLLQPASSAGGAPPTFFDQAVAAEHIGHATDVGLHTAPGQCPKSRAPTPLAAGRQRSRDTGWSE